MRGEEIENYHSSELTKSHMNITTQRALYRK